MKAFSGKKALRSIVIILRILIMVLLLGAWTSGNSTSQKNDESAVNFEIYEAQNDGSYCIIGLNGSKALFLNRVHGYGVILPQEMKVTDDSSTGIRIVLEDRHRRMEIYKQPLSVTDLSAEAYISYSNRFLENSDEHKVELHKNMEINGFPAVINQWSREKLLHISNDKNYYACVDIITEDYVYTFFFKSDMPFDQCDGYLELTEGFFTFIPAVRPAAVKFEHTINKLWDQKTRRFFKRYFSDDSTLSWGIFEHTAPKDMSELDDLEEKMNFDFKFLLVYKNVQKVFEPNYVKAELQNAYNNGKTVELTLQTSNQDTGEGNMVYDILDGNYDVFLKSFATEVAEFGHPVLFRFCNEMNGDWCVYSAYHTSRDTEIYKELYKYVYKIFEDADADNVIWIWNPNEKSYPNFEWNNEILYYPGDEYVDVIGLTGYNNGTYYKDETWREFTEIYDPLYQKAELYYHKPLMITEFSSSSVGGNKEEWVNDMFSNIDKYPRIKVAIWWNGCDRDADGNVARPYFIDETEELINVFRKNFKDYK